MRSLIFYWPAVATALLLAGLVFGAASKVYGEYHDSFWLSRETYYFSIAVEAGLAVLLLHRRVRTFGFWAVAVTSLVGLAFAQFREEGNVCGCLGGLLEVSRAQSSLLLGMAGLLATSALMARKSVSAGAGTAP